MVKSITINGIPCRFKSSAAIPRIYRIRYGRDIFVDLQKLADQIKKSEKVKKSASPVEEAGVQGEDESDESSLPIESLELFENIAYIMHKHGDSKQPDDIGEWLDQFETFDIYKILPEILTMWNIENAQLSESKKKLGR